MLRPKAVPLEKGGAGSEDFGTAARCDGESAHYEASSYPGGADRRLAASELRPLLVAFARDQAGRRGCSHLALPGQRIIPNGR
ncbi:hypothetical protein [Streptomyces nigrescens]